MLSYFAVMMADMKRRMAVIMLLNLDFTINGFLTPAGEKREQWDNTRRQKWLK